ncbi:carbon-nitrogen hydrolase family protein [Vibrio algarum]|uniref:Carbon-nitrogen hydrolase family protein n=1 Tax=Vibrio algarum TaxID=3020714 RepID=A0ABT4YMV2_9VIBR|nr:carbon-nitrogen hydrolase family protein [Vibrio sp. KJ40-1]MDB1122881.1 carbon-nitrogen hydrolase family protein [Vibrio sp. KJ40-1]
MHSIGVIQMTSGPEPLKNLAFIDIQLKQLAKDGAKLVLTPENCVVFGSKDDYRLNAEQLGSGIVQEQLFAMAKRYKLWLVIGSMPIIREDKISTTCIVINSMGELVADYDKLHMFDADVDDKHTRYRESEVFQSGERVVVVDTPIGKLGLAICYDIRFPQLFSKLVSEGAEIITLPAAFTAPTGDAHWEVLLRARAIETQCWLIASGQTGRHPCGRETWGHSMIVSPWGKITQQLSSEVGVLLDDIDHRITQSVRSNMPLQRHVRFQTLLTAE